MKLRWEFLILGLVTFFTTQAEEAQQWVQLKAQPIGNCCGKRVITSRCSVISFPRHCFEICQRVPEDCCGMEVWEACLQTSCHSGLEVGAAEDQHLPLRTERIHSLQCTFAEGTFTLSTSDPADHRRTFFCIS